MRDGRPITFSRGRRLQCGTRRSITALIWPSTLDACAFSGEAGGNLSHRLASSVAAARSCRRTCPSSDFSTAVILALGHALDDPTRTGDGRVACMSSVRLFADRHSNKALTLIVVDTPTLGAGRRGTASFG